MQTLSNYQAYINIIMKFKMLQHQQVGSTCQFGKEPMAHGVDCRYTYCNMIA